MSRLDLGPSAPASLPVDLTAKKNLQGIGIETKQGEDMIVVALPPFTSPITTRRQQKQDETFNTVAGPEVFYNHIKAPKTSQRNYRKLESIMEFPPNSFGTPKSTRRTSNSHKRKGAPGKYKARSSQQLTRGVERHVPDEHSLSPGLISAIFHGIAQSRGGREGSKKLARLTMDEAGRWRVIRFSKPVDTFPQDFERGAIR